MLFLACRQRLARLLILAFGMIVLLPALTLAQEPQPPLEPSWPSLPPSVSPPASTPALVPSSLPGATTDRRPRDPALGQAPQGPAALPWGITQAVRHALARLPGARPRQGALVAPPRISTDQRWAFGSVALLPARDAAAEQFDADLPEGRLWLARQTQAGWVAALEYTPRFNQWLQEAPFTLVSPVEKAILGSATQEGAAAATGAAARLPPNQLALPWAAGQRWTLTGGPHGWEKKGKQRPWSALDFAGGDGRVLAAREGLVYRPCGKTTWVQIRHPDGWVTDYYHLTHIPRYANGTWIERGQYVGQIGTSVACGGRATGPHVHFNIRYKGKPVAWDGQQLGGWTIHEGAKPYQGYATKQGVRVSPGQGLANDGQW